VVLLRLELKLLLNERALEKSTKFKKSLEIICGFQFGGNFWEAQTSNWCSSNPRSFFEVSD
jgi:hypothetical protein